MARVIKVVLISTGTKRGYSLFEWRTVECEEGQKGYLSERGVKVLYRSHDLYRPRAKRSDSQGLACRRRAEEIAAVARRAMVVGLVSDTPEGIVRDRETDLYVGV